MDHEPAPAPNSPAATPPAAGLRSAFPHAPAVIGVVVVSAFLAVGVWVKQQIGSRSRTNGEVAVVRAMVAQRRAELGTYNERLQNLRWRASKIHAWADTQSEPVRSWARERSRLFDQLVQQIDRGEDAERLESLSKEIELRVATGDADAAKALAQQLPEIKYPPAEVFRQQQNETYLVPLAQLSRQNPDFYRAFQNQEPDAARGDVTALREELSSADSDQVTPQQMMKFELLSAVLPPSDPVLAEWTAVASASDYFENPDGATLARWRKTQRALRLHNWQEVVAQMQSIMRTTVRTRQPFRAAYGWAILKDRPDRRGEAYPFLQEAAAAGDATARAWVASEDIAQGRTAQAARWLETGVAAGDKGAVIQLVQLYARDDVPKDAAREVGALQRIVVAPDAPPNAWILLGRLYENGQGVAISAGQAYQCYARAAEKNFVPAWTEVARCLSHGIGVPPDVDQAVAWASRAYEAGERDGSVTVLIDLMRRDPTRVAGRIQEMFEHEQVAGPAGYQEFRANIPGIAQLRLMLAKYFDEKGQFGSAARLYARSGAAASQRLSELTESHTCDTCGGSGKITSSAPCPTCGGKGTVVCSHCGGVGFTYEPGSPPCTTCDGKGSVVQEGRVVSCAACGGTGKGKGSVIKKDCAFCSHGQMKCPDCTDGRIKILKECPECHGVGHWTMADHGS